MADKGADLPEMVIVVITELVPTIALGEDDELRHVYTLYSSLREAPVVAIVCMSFEKADMPDIRKRQ